nr:unnamed protein product [Haemonchus contortus]
MVRLLHPIFSTSTTLRSNWGSVVGAGVVLTNREKCSPSKLGAVRPHSKKENSINLRPAEDMNMRRLNERRRPDCSAISGRLSFSRAIRSGIEDRPCRPQRNPLYPIATSFLISI